jgi:hypothetical protein
MTRTTTSEQNWIYEQLEPGQLAQGNYKRYQPLEPKLAKLPQQWPTDAEIAEYERLQDEHLKRHGVPCEKKQL